MRFSSELKVLGMRSSKGEYEGTKYDKTVVYVETQFDETKGNAKGFAVADYNLGTSDEFEKYKHLSFPFIAQADMEIVTTGKDQRTIMRGLKPVAALKDKP